MKEKFTKGEWQAAVRDGKGNEFYVYSDDLTGSAIANVNFEFVRRSTEEKHANAHLIAAAPEMYSMLQSIIALGVHPEDEKRINKLLAKARGESNE